MREIDYHIGPLRGSGEWWLGQVTSALHTVVTGLRDGLRDSPGDLPFEEPPSTPSSEDVDLLADEPSALASMRDRSISMPELLTDDAPLLSPRDRRLSDVDGSSQALAVEFEPPSCISSTDRSLSEGSFPTGGSIEALAAGGSIEGATSLSPGFMV